MRCGLDAVAKWATNLGYDRVQGAFFTPSSPELGVHRFGPELREILLSKQGANAGGVYCLDDVPTVCLVSSEALDVDQQRRNAQLRALCERLWNQNLARVILVVENDVLEAWSVDNPDAEPERFSESTGSQVWSAIGLLNGKALETRDGWFDPKKRVDRDLLDSIQVLIEKLHEGGLEVSRTHRLIARVIFVTYLEDRGIIGEAYRASRGVRPLFDLINEADAAGLRTLFSHLRADFNGDFLTTTDVEESWGDIDLSSFAWLAKFLGRTTLRSMQMSFWRYDFSHIPIELIASIYETFLAGGDASGASRRRQGAYYTPRVLADWVVDQVLVGRNVLEERILDPACGSGMLLTAAFRRLIRTSEADAVRQGGSSTASFAERKRLLVEHIFGGDVDEDACQLTAFSLYLALLSDLDPADLEVLSRGGHKLPSLASNIMRGSAGDFFSAEAEGRVEEFTLLLSNPPWHQLAAAEPAMLKMNAWILRQKAPKPHVPKRQIAAAFALGAADRVAPGGRVALILPSNLFASGDATQRQFRAHLIGRLRIRQIVNFADMRRLIFADSAHPFVVITAEARRSDERFQSIEGERFEYWTPKADISLALGRLIIHGADRALLPTQALLDPTPQLSIRYWGSQTDLNLLGKLRRYGRIRDLVLHREWLDAKGFHRKDEDKRHSPDTWYSDVPEWMAKRRFLATTRLPSDVPVVPVSNLGRLPYTRIAREIPKRLCEGPRVLWPDGAHPEEGVKAVYSEVPFSFQHTMAVLSPPKSELNRQIAKFLAVYLRSPLGLWLLFLLSSSVASERPKLHVQEALEWPFWHPEDHPRPAVAARILERCDRLMKEIEEAHVLSQPRLWESSRAEFNSLVYSYFCLERNEISAVEELAEYIGPAIQPSSLSFDALNRPLRKPPDAMMLTAYCESLSEAVGAWRDATGGRGSVTVTAWTAARVPIGAAVLKLGKGRSGKSRVADDRVFDELAQTFERLYSSSTNLMLSTPDLALVEDDTIFLIKPLIARFWLTRRAQEDASQLAIELQSIAVRSSRDQVARA